MSRGPRKHHVPTRGYRAAAALSCPQTWFSQRYCLEASEVLLCKPVGAPDPTTDEADAGEQPAIRYMAQSSGVRSLR